MSRSIGEVTMEEVLALAVAKWGPGVCVSIMDMGGPELDVFERDKARLELAAHLTTEPRFTQEEALSPGMTIAQLRALHEREHAAWRAWGQRQAELEEMAYRFKYRLSLRGELEPARTRISRRFGEFPSEHNFTRHFDGFTWFEVLEKAGLITAAA
jgi:hypothetical protein